MFRIVEDGVPSVVHTQSPTSQARDVAGLRAAPEFHRFVTQELLPGTEVVADRFWAGLAGIVDAFADRTAELLAERLRLQAEIHTWHRSNGTGNVEAYERFLRGIGYLVDTPSPRPIETSGLDSEIATIAGPQLVVPVTNARYAINAANARWGSLYDALYGTDALGSPPPPGAYDPARGAVVIERVRQFLDEVAPLTCASHRQVTAYRIYAGSLRAELDDGRTADLIHPDRVVGHRGPGDDPRGIVLRHHNLAIEVVIDRTHTIGRDDPAGVADVRVESAVTTIMDCEDSVATVSTDEKIGAYRNWLGLMRGDLTAEVIRSDGTTFTRSLNPDINVTAPDGATVSLPGRSLLLVRNVGSHLTSELVLDSRGRAVPETLIDAAVTVACALHDLSSRRNSAEGSVYVVKPKMHGPAEVALAAELFATVEDVLGLAPGTVKIGIMDEERRTSLNLGACIDAARTRVAFINTGFLDRTGDEIHTAMEAGPVVTKEAMRAQPWIDAYERRNVAIGLAFGLGGRAQIGKGMWAKPDHMAAMLEEKVGHPASGASCAWVPSPTAATLHALHYHAVDVVHRQRELAANADPGAGWVDLLTVPVAQEPPTEDERRSELERNAQSILGYVVRWVDHGVGCSKVPDLDGVALMEDRATCRISSQHLANWLHHGVTDLVEIRAVMERMAAIVDDQNADDPAYRPMAPACDGPAFRAAWQLVVGGRDEPAGYTEDTLSAHRAEVHRADAEDGR